MWNLLLSAWVLVVRRSLAEARLLLSIALGVLLAVTLLASAPLYSDALNALGLAHQLRSQPLELEAVQVLLNLYPGTREEYTRLDGSVGRGVEGRLGPIFREQSRYSRSAVFYMADPEETPDLVLAMETQAQAETSRLQTLEAISSARRQVQAAREAAEASRDRAAVAELAKAEEELKNRQSDKGKAQSDLEKAEEQAARLQRASLLAEQALVPGDQRREQALLKAKEAEQTALGKVAEARRALTRISLTEQVAALKVERSRRTALRTQDPALGQWVTEMEAALAEMERTLAEQQRALPGIRQGVQDRLQPDFRDRAYFQFLTGIEEQIRITAGAFPRPYDPDSQAEIEVLVSAKTASAFHLEPGSRFAVLPYWADATPMLMARVVGVAERIDPTAEYWLLENPLEFELDPNQVPTWQTALLLVPEGSLFEGLGQAFPAHVVSTYAWRYYIDRDQITTRSADLIAPALKSLRVELGSEYPRSYVLTVLDELLTQYRSKRLFTQLPVYLVLMQVAGIILYYVTMATNMLIERRAGDIALLKDRGASMGQLMVIHLMEGLLICGLAFLVGPFLALGSVALLGETPAFQVLSGGGLLPTRLSPPVFGWAAAAALPSLLALLIPAFQVARVSLIQQRHRLARPAQVPWWQRFHLDLVLLAVGGLLYWQVRRQGALVNRTFFGELALDPLQLLTPTLLMVALAVIFLRLFPLLLAGASRLFAALTPTPIFLSLAYVGRNPLPYTRLILLLILITTLGFFSAVFGGTLERSLRERTHYDTGADIRITMSRNLEVGKGRFLARYREVPGVEAATAVYRSSGPGGARTPLSSTLLAIDPVPFSQMVWYRKDFGPETLRQLSLLLTAGSLVGQGLALPMEAKEIGLWVQPFVACPRCQLLARLQDSTGTYWDLELKWESLREDPKGSEEFTSLQTRDWRFLRAELPGEMEPPVTLSALFLRYQGAGANPVRGLRFDALQASDGQGGRVVLEDFEKVSSWAPLPRGNQQDTLGEDHENFWQGAGSGRLEWGAAASGAVGIQVLREAAPVQAIASRSFLKARGLKVGDLLTMDLARRQVSLRIVAAVDYFPTLDPAGEGFLIANGNQLSQAVNYLPGPYSVYPSEVWLSTSTRGEERRALVQALGTVDPLTESVSDRAEMLSRAAADPLTSAGWRGVLDVAFLSVTVVGALGFLVYSYLFAQRRQVEFAMLRTMGFTARQIGVLITFELFLVVASGVMAGSLIGMLLGRMMLPFLQLTEVGQRVLPPFLITVGWGEAARIYAVLLAAFVASSAAIVRYFSHLEVPLALRFGE